LILILEIQSMPREICLPLGLIAMFTALLSCQVACSETAIDYTVSPKVVAVHVRLTEDGKRQAAQATRLCFLGDGKTIVVGDRKGQLYKWQSGEKNIQTFGNLEPGAVTGLAFAADGRWVAAIANGGRIGTPGTLALWNVDGTEQNRFALGESPQPNVVFARETPWMAYVSASKPGEVRVLKPAPGDDFVIEKRVPLSFENSSWISAVAISPKADLLAIGRTVFLNERRLDPEAGGRIQLVKISDATRIREFVGHNDSPRALEFSHDGSRLASLGSFNDNSLYVWDVESGEKLLSIGYLGGTSKLRFTPDNRYLVTILSQKVEDSYAIVVWDVETGMAVSTTPLDVLGEPSFDLDVPDFDLSADGHFLSIAVLDSRNKGTDLTPEVVLFEFPSSAAPR
jgi:WD40 repeat protein